MKTIIAILLIAFIANSVISQEIPDDLEQEIPEVEAFILEWINNSNVSVISQTGETNSIISIQHQNGNLANAILSDQSGISNSGYLNQSGSLNQTFLKQNGNGNEANIWSSGQQIFTGAIQMGSNNKLNSYIENQGVLPKAAVIKQNGSNNTVELALLGNGWMSDSWPKAAAITQNGNNLEFSAKLESFSSPVLINQQSGQTGEGMKINISNSAFYFPMK